LLLYAGGLVAIVSKHLRSVVGLLQTGFHVAQTCVFGWGFHTNLAMLALVFLPVFMWTPRVVAALERAAWRRGVERRVQEVTIRR
jgi:hypothetical protein